MFRYCFLFLLACSWWFVPGTAAKTIFVSLAHLPPQIYQEGDQVLGLYADIINIVCSRLGIEPEFQLYSWKRAMRLVQTGEVDAIFPPIFTVERASFLYFPTEPMTTKSNVIFKKKENPLIIKTIEDLKHFSISLIPGYAYAPIFDRRTDLHRLYLDSIANQVKMLAKGRTDLAVAAKKPFLYYAQQLGLADMFRVAYPLGEEKSYVAFSKAKGKSHKHLAEQFSQVLVELKQEGIIDQLEDKYRLPLPPGYRGQEAGF